MGLEFSSGIPDSGPKAFEHRRIPAITKVLVTAFLLAGTLFGGLDETGVLCLGSDGHVSLEAGGIEGCVPVKAPTEKRRIDWASIGTSHCGPCIDLPLLSASKNTTLVSSIPETQAPAACFSTHATALSPNQFVSQIADRLAESPFLSIKPHTIVLRC